jgi:hypothetical protein
LSDYTVKNSKKLSFWNKLQICWSILKWVGTIGLLRKEIKN